jgi:hypothetical protein
MRDDGARPEQMPIIAADAGPPARGLPHRSTGVWCALAAIVWGVVAAWIYHLQGLTLSHYDAKAHLVVARRVIDSITPGWQQIGAVWLPLPHLLNLLPVQVDALYRTGVSGIAISILSMGLRRTPQPRWCCAPPARAPARCSAVPCWRSIRTSCTCNRRR